MPKTADAGKPAAKTAAKAAGKVAAKAPQAKAPAAKAAAPGKPHDGTKDAGKPNDARPATLKPVAKPAAKPAAKEAAPKEPKKDAAAKPAPTPQKVEGAKVAPKAAPAKAAAPAAKPVVAPAKAQVTKGSPPAPAKPAPKSFLVKPQPKVDAKSDKDKGDPKPPLERVVERVVNGVRSMVWGPVDTKRFGRTVVVDLAVPQVAMTARRGLAIPRASMIVTTAAREIMTLAREAVKIDTVALVGSDTDPSAHPDLREITENLRALRDKHLPRAKLRVFTSTRDLSRYDLRSTLAMYDRVHLQLEWGTAKLFSAVTNEKPAQLTTLLKNAGTFDHLVVEAAFFKGSEDHDNSSDTEVKSWIKKLQELKPQEVHILPGAGSGASLPKTKPVPKSRRDEIVEEVAEKTGLSVVSVPEDDIALT